MSDSNKPKKLLPDYWRQLDFYSPNKTDTVLVIGAGSIGSYHAYALARMGIGKVIVVDFDKVEGHNLPNQFFSEKDMIEGVNKTMALYKTTDLMLSKNPIVPMDGKAENLLPNLLKTEKIDAISITVDTMEARKNIYNILYKSYYNGYLIDGRVGGLFASVYTIPMRFDKYGQYYEDSLHSDEEIPELPCTARSVVDISFQVAGAMATAVRNVLSNGNKYPVHIFYDYKMGQSWVMQENFVVPGSTNSLPIKEVSNV